MLRVKEFADRLSIVDFLHEIFSLDLEHGMTGLMNFCLKAATAHVSIELIQTFPANSNHF